MASAALRLFQRLGGSAPGRWLVSRAICWRAPYFASIAPRIDVLEPGRCVVRIRDRRAVRNHIGSIERARSEPRLGTLIRLIGALDTTPDEILDGIRWRPGEEEEEEDR